MGQCLLEEFAASELVTDDVPELLRRQNPSLPTFALVYAAKQPAIANRERPSPELPKTRRAVGRKKDKLSASDQVLGWDVADGRKHTAILDRKSTRLNSSHLVNTY